MKKWTKYLILFGVVFAVALGGVLYGVLTHKEPGLLGVCWNGPSVGAYDDPLKDPHPECTTKVQWPKSQMPLTYFVDLDTAPKDYVKSIHAAAKMWNDEIGPVFVQDDDDRADVLVVWGSPRGNEGGSTTHSLNDDGTLSATVELVEASDLRAIYRFAAHEFGHVLGLAHDQAPRSIMFPTQPGTTYDKEMTFVLPSDYDKKLLRKLYR